MPAIIGMEHIMSVITGTTASDILSGTDEADTLFGLAGRDVLNGGSGNDLLSGGAGNDLYWVDTASDQVQEEADGGEDTVWAMADFTLPNHIERLELQGSDGLSGTGNGQANILIGNSGNNLLQGGDGNDRLEGRGGNDSLLGGAGDDSLYGNAGDDTLSGGSGNDLYSIGVGSDVVQEEADSGEDTVWTTADFTLPDHAERLELQGSDGLNGTGNAQANVLVGNRGNNMLHGGEGNDRLEGRGGNDSLLGGAGDDTLYGNAGDDTLAGGAGNDLYIIGVGSDVMQEEADGGIDTVDSQISCTLSDNIENLLLRGLVTHALGNALDNVITGSVGANSLNGAEGNDSLWGGPGGDTLVGGAGNDWLFGGAGADTYIVSDAGDIITERAAGGADNVLALASYVLPAHIERLVCGEGVAVNGSGNEGANVLTGNEMANSLFGDAGNDSLVGGAGNDTLAGGTGVDYLLGGDGADRFVFAAGGGRDRIGDFQDGSDLLDLSQAGVLLFNRLQINFAEGTTTIAYGTDYENRIILVGVTSSQISGADFVFAAT